MRPGFGALFQALLLVAVAASEGPASAGTRLDTEGGGSRNLWTHIEPGAARAPAEVRIEVLVTPSDDNRTLDVTVDSANYYRGSSIELDGARAARFHAVAYRDMPAGTYTVIVRLRARQGVLRAVQHQIFRIVP
jgi:hypothetical protein